MFHRIVMDKTPKHNTLMTQSRKLTDAKNTWNHMLTRDPVSPRPLLICFPLSLPVASLNIALDCPHC